MKTIIFDGNQSAAQREELLLPQVEHLRAQGIEVRVAAIVFVEDAGSLLYTQLKAQAAARVGMAYQVQQFSLTDQVDQVAALLGQLNSNPSVTGIIIQKPTRRVWSTITGNLERADFNQWWLSLTSLIDSAKDVDGLHQSTLALIESGQWQAQGRVLPATAKAVWSILTDYFATSSRSLSEQQVAIIGRSQLLGLPLAAVLRHIGCEVTLLGSKELTVRNEQGTSLHNFDVIVSSTGRSKLVTGAMIDEGAVVIDVGEPRPDVERATVEGRAAFLTPVPGGVGPMTVVSLLENALELVS